MIEKLHGVLTERELLGKLINDPDSLAKLDRLQEKHFYSRANQVIYSAIKNLNNDGKIPDLLAVTDSLKRSGDLERVGGAYYLTGLIEGIVSSATIAQDENRLIQYWQRRELYTGLIDLANQLETLDIANVEGDILNLLERVESSRSGTFRILVDVANDYLIEYDKEKSGNDYRLVTGFKDLDGIFCGFRPGDLMYLAGATSSGKTALALGISYRLISQRIPVGYISLEMSSVQIFHRLVLETGHNGATATAKIADLPFFINDSGEGIIGRILSQANLLVRRHKIRLLILDHLQLVSGNGENRNQELTAISGALKRFAVRNKIAILGLSQLNRKGADDIPKLEHLRDSGALEQDADYVLLLYRDRTAKSDDSNIAYLDLAKNRHGKTGQFRLTFLDGVFKDFTRDAI